MLNNQINEIMSNAIEKIKTLVDTGTVVGVPFETKEGTLIIPLTKVSVGFVAGGGDRNCWDDRSVSSLMPDTVWSSLILILPSCYFC